MQKLLRLWLKITTLLVEKILHFWVVLQFWAKSYYIQYMYITGFTALLDIYYISGSNKYLFLSESTPLPQNCLEFVETKPQFLSASFPNDHVRVLKVYCQTQDIGQDLDNGSVGQHDRLSFTNAFLHSNLPSLMLPHMSQTRLCTRNS